MHVHVYTGFGEEKGGALDIFSSYVVQPLRSTSQRATLLKEEKTTLQININDTMMQSQCQTVASRSTSKFVNIAMNCGKLFVKTNFLNGFYFYSSLI
jgi:hypothetical protein